MAAVAAAAIALYGGESQAQPTATGLDFTGPATGLTAGEVF